MQDLALYFHWPYCLAKCPYCDFNVHVAERIDHKRWREAYLRALSFYAQAYPKRRIVSIYFGGGTPSLMEPRTIEDILQHASDLWEFAEDIEITLEANPTSAELSRFHDFRAAGVNRLSLGVQSLDDDWLSFLGRKHSGDEARQAIALAQSIFDRMSFDLIYARPGQDLAQWRDELTRGLDIARSQGGGHMSVYQLTIERNTPFYMRKARGEFVMPDEDLAADFFELTQELCAHAGMPAYEVSNHAVPGQESRHNLVYWRYGDYLGIGPGAHGRMCHGNKQIHALRDHYAPQRWLELVEENGRGAHDPDVLPEAEQAFEALMMGLRLYEGMNIGPFLQFIDLNALDMLASQGMLCYEGDHVRLLADGMIRLNSVLNLIYKG